MDTNPLQCETCCKRLPAYAQHSECRSCREAGGLNCQSDNTCHICCTWSKGTWKLEDKYRKDTATKREHRARSVSSSSVSSSRSTKSAKKSHRSERPLQYQIQKPLLSSEEPKRDSRESVSLGPHPTEQFHSLKVGKSWLESNTDSSSTSPQNSTDDEFEDSPQSGSSPNGAKRREDGAKRATEVSDDTTQLGAARSGAQDGAAQHSSSPTGNFSLCPSPKGAKRREAKSQTLPNSLESHTPAPHSSSRREAMPKKRHKKRKHSSNRRDDLDRRDTVHDGAKRRIRNHLVPPNLALTHVTARKNATIILSGVKLPRPMSPNHTINGNNP